VLPEWITTKPFPHLLKMNITLTNPRTGEFKPIKVGWSWVLFFFAGFWGIPLFLRKLYVWGGIFLFLGITNTCQSWIGNLIADDELTRGAIGFGVLVSSIIFMGLNVHIAVKGNELTAKNYLEHGWVFAFPNSMEAMEAKRRWGIRDVGTYNQSNSSSMKKCPYCAEDIQQEAIKCKHCGSILNDQQPV
jgi:hypothetical protein